MPLGEGPRGSVQLLTLQLEKCMQAALLSAPQQLPFYPGAMLGPILYSLNDFYKGGKDLRGFRWRSHWVFSS